MIINTIITVISENNSFICYLIRGRPEINSGVLFLTFSEVNQELKDTDKKDNNNCKCNYKT